MRMIDHFIEGGTAGLMATRMGAVMDPNNGGQQAEVVLGSADALERAVAAAQAAQPGWGHGQGDVQEAKEVVRCHMAVMNVSTARENLPEAVELARTEAVFLERYGQPAAVLVSPEHYARLTAA